MYYRQHHKHMRPTQRGHLQCNNGISCTEGSCDHGLEFAVFSSIAGARCYLELRQVRQDSDGAEPDTMGRVRLCKNSPELNM